uniref:Dual specificity phosphatase 22 n=1 Tax=Salarias fasciatus TaxID=181472 RepID=A0A672FHC7_SALFA
HCNGIHRNSTLPGLYLLDINTFSGEETYRRCKMKSPSSLIFIEYSSNHLFNVSGSTRTQYFRDSIMFIHESRLKGEGCLVHCVAGVSRSVTLVVAYIMTVTGRGWVEALAAVRSARPCAGPNLGFLRQLEEFENTELREVRAASSLTLASSNIMEIMENTLKVLEGDSEWSNSS